MKEGGVMFPWNFFNNSNKNNFDPFKFINENNWQKILEQFSTPFPEDMSAFFSPDKKTSDVRTDAQPKVQTLNEKVYETHEQVFIRIPISDEKILSNLKIYYSLNKCMIDGFHEVNSPYTIILPATVKKKGAKAIYKDHILEIQIQKNLDWQISEIKLDQY